MDKIINIYDREGRCLSSLSDFILEKEDGFYVCGSYAICPFRAKTLKGAIDLAAHIDVSVCDVHKKNMDMKPKQTPYKALKDDMSLDILNQLYREFARLAEEERKESHLAIRYRMTANEILRDKAFFDFAHDGVIAISSGSFSLSIPRSIKTLLHFISKYESLCGISKRKQRILLL
ncbi:MAG: hypothetical protein K5854_01665 [Prevotella sp.]|nr:hypothetical protein [Prevotella sp.]